MRGQSTLLHALLFCFAVVLPALAFPQGFKRDVQRRAPSSLKQVTREQIIARSKTRPAKRQTSAAPYPLCPDAPTQDDTLVSVATFFNVGPSTLGDELGTTLASDFYVCQAICANTPGCTIGVFVDNRCTYYTSGTGFGDLAGAVVSIQDITCATAIGTDPGLAGLSCCNSFA